MYGTEYIRLRIFVGQFSRRITFSLKKIKEGDFTMNIAGLFTTTSSGIADWMTAIVAFVALIYAICEYTLHKKAMKKEMEKDDSEDERREKEITVQIEDMYMNEIGEQQRSMLEYAAAIWGYCVLFNGVQDYSAGNTDPRNKLMETLSDGERINQIRENNKEIAALQTYIEEVRMCAMIIQNCIERVQKIDFFKQGDEIFDELKKECETYSRYVGEFVASCFVTYFVFMDRNSDKISNENEIHTSEERWLKMVIDEGNIYRCEEEMTDRGKQVLSRTKGKDRHALNWSDYLFRDTESDLINSSNVLREKLIHAKRKYLNK